MKHSLTNRALGVSGDSNTTSVTVRLPSEVVDFMDSHRNGRIKNRSEFLQHWAQVGVRVSSSDELSEALDWALEWSVQEITAATITPESLGVDAVEIVIPITGYEVPNVDGSERPKPTADELATIRESQLEAMRNRLR